MPVSKRLFSVGLLFCVIALAASCVNAPGATPAPGQAATSTLPAAAMTAAIALSTNTPVTPTAALTGTVPAVTTAAPVTQTARLSSTVPISSTPPITATIPLTATAPISGTGPITATATVSTTGATFTNPVLSYDFPDPHVIRAGPTFYAYATNGSGKNIQVATSPDLVNWELQNDALPALPSWAQLGGSYVWAPGVIQIGQTYVMYYVARSQQYDKQCIGVATSKTPGGPFTDSNSAPFVCQPDQGGSIDPMPLADNGKLYLYWKNDGNCCGMTTYLYGQEMSADGLKLTGSPQQLIHNTELWEGNLVEAPFMFKHNGRYYLFFSANNYATEAYAVGYATCDTALGPCRQAPENPILKSRMTPPLVIGPGGESLLQVGDQTWMFYHAWNIVGGTRGDSRYMWLDRVDWPADKPVVHGPTTGPQPAPQIPPATPAAPAAQATPTP
jgi:beta-xylosidase